MERGGAPGRTVLPVLLLYVFTSPLRLLLLLDYISLRLWFTCVSENNCVLTEVCLLQYLNKSGLCFTLQADQNVSEAHSAVGEVLLQSLDPAPIEETGQFSATIQADSEFNGFYSTCLHDTDRHN